MLDLMRRNTNNVINVNDMDDLIGKVELIDIREPYEYNTGSIATAVNIPMGDLLNAPEKYLKKENTYYIMCQSGGRSSRACSILAQQGYQIVNVSGGMGSYVGSKRK